MTTRLGRIVRHLLAADGQCKVCGQWFPDWNGGTCGSCQDKSG